MKKTILTLFVCLPLFGMAQTKPDTTQLKTNIKTLSLAANIISQRTDISVKDGIATLNLLQSLIQSDMALLEQERKRGKK